MTVRNPLNWIVYWIAAHLRISGSGPEDMSPPLLGFSRSHKTLSPLISHPPPAAAVARTVASPQGLQRYGHQPRSLHGALELSASRSAFVAAWCLIPRVISYPGRWWCRCWRRRSWRSGSSSSRGPTSTATSASRYTLCPTAHSLVAQSLVHLAFAAWWIHWPLGS